jgi:hypothetical protein
MVERLPGGNTGGAVLVDGTVRRARGAWTPTVHALLTHLHDRGFTRAPRPLGYDEEGREVLSYLPGTTVGDRKPWPAWVHAADTLLQAAGWLRDYHAAVADFVPPADATWRAGEQWTAGQIVCHNDAAPYNAAWNDGRLVGFFDWDFAAPAPPEWDLAFTAFAWVPLHARRVVAAEGFVAFGDRRRRLEAFVGAYGWSGSIADLLQILDRRLDAHCNTIRDLAAGGDEHFQRLLDAGAVDDVMAAREELGNL